MSTTLGGVSTTGIYCRAGCPASPLPAHVTSFPTAAAAEAAGHRACLRCRPYRTSDVDGWMDAPELVCRAVRLIVDGSLDAGGEEQLAHRLGVSARHLRRLFSEHVGATPDQLARSRRAHFARRLLDDTDLPIVDVSTAAGYGSVRQLGRELGRVFRASPSELRRRRRRSDRLAADGGLDLRLPVRGPLDWCHTLGFLEARAVPGVETVAGSVYRRTIIIDGDPGVVEVSFPDGGDGQVRSRLHLPHWDGLIHVVARTRRTFGLDVDPSPALGILRADPLLGPLVGRRPGVRVPGAWDPWEVAVRAVVGQQISVPAATTVMGRIVERFGTEVVGLGSWQLTHTFPPPRQLAEADPRDISGCGLTGRRSHAIVELARCIDGGELALDGRSPLDELMASAEALPGIGPWTSAYLAMRLGERDAFPATDLALRRVTGMDAIELAARSEAWRPWRALAAVHLWRAAADSVS